MADLSRFIRLKKEVEQAQQQADRAQGALDQLLQQLKDDFECESIEEADEKLKSLEKKKNKAEQAFDESLRAFEEKWKENL